MKPCNERLHPAVLYRYRSLGSPEREKQELDAILGSYIFAPKFDEMNDPMEALFEPYHNRGLINSSGQHKLDGADGNSFMDFVINTCNTNIPKVNNSFEKIVKLLRVSGLISMSETHLNYPLWAYYASNFEGICLGFDTQELKISTLPRRQLSPQPVIYDSNIPGSICPETGGRRPMNTVFRQKREEWAHEKEWRYLAGKRGNKWYIDTALKYVYLGPRIDSKVKDKIVKALEKRPVRVYEGLLRGYDIEFRRIKNAVPWSQCEKIGANKKLDQCKVFIFEKDLRTALGAGYEALKRKCYDFRAHPNVESVDEVRLMEAEGGACIGITVTYRFRNNSCLCYQHIFDTNMNPITSAE